MSLQQENRDKALARFFNLLGDVLEMVVPLIRDEIKRRTKCPR